MNSAPTPFYRSRNLLAILALGLLTLLVFGQSARFDYVEFDDDVFIKNNPALKQGLSTEGIRWAFSANFLKTSPGAEYWAPITLLTRLADYELYGFDPKGHHRTSLIIHLLAGFALLGMLQTLTGRFWESLLVAALFLTHPMHVEPVCWLSARKDLVSGLFFILAIWAYAIYGKKPGVARYLLLLTAFIAANMAKPMAVSLPFLFAFLDFWPLDRWKTSLAKPRWPIWKLVLEKLPFLAIAIFVSSLAIITQRGLGAVADDDLLPLPWRLGNAILSTGTYLFKAIIPIDLALLYPHPGKTLNLPLTALSGVILLAICVAVYRARERRPWLIVGFLWFIFVLGPVIGIIQIGGQAMADRYSYLSFIGLFIALVWEMAARFSSQSSSRPAWLASLGVIGVFSYTAYLQTQTWRNSLTAFAHALEVTDNNYIMHFNYGSELLKHGERDKAFAHLQEAVRIRAPINDYLIAKAEEDARAGNYPPAIRRINTVLRMMPWNAELHTKLGKIYHLHHQNKLGRREYAAAIHYHPAYLPARLALAESLADDHLTDEALQATQAALAIDPANTALLALQEKLRASPAP